MLNQEISLGLWTVPPHGKASGSPTGPGTQIDTLKAALVLLYEPGDRLVDLHGVLKTCR